VREQTFKSLFKRNLFNQVIDIAPDMLEGPLDNLLDNELLKEIPIVKTFINTANIALAYKEKSFLKKTLKFITTFNNGDISEDSFLEFQEMFITNPNFADNVLENILLFLDRITEEEKASFLAQLFLAYLNGNITWEEFIHLSICLEKLHPKVYGFLKRIAKTDSFSITKRYPLHESLLTSAGIGNRHGTKFEVNEFGQKLFKYGLSDLIKNEQL
jgi:hypothetical protein